MSSWVFVARAVSDATQDELDFVRAVGEALSMRGRSVRLGGRVIEGVTDAEVANENVSALVQADALVAILPVDGLAVSSIWIEIGIAIAANVPSVIVAGAGARLPFLLPALATARPQHVALIQAASSVEGSAQNISMALLRMVNQRQ